MLPEHEACMHLCTYDSKELIYIYDNLNSQFLINLLNIMTQIRKSHSPSIASSKRARYVTKMSTQKMLKQK